MTRGRRWDGRRITRLRERLGSVTRPLSRRDLVRVLNERLPAEVRVAESSLRRYEEESVEPPYEVAAAMAVLAGVGFEEFALGSAATPADVPVVYGPAPMVTPRREPPEGMRPSAATRRKGA